MRSSLRRVCEVRQFLLSEKESGDGEGRREEAAHFVRPSPQTSSLHQLDVPSKRSPNHRERQLLVLASEFLLKEVVEGRSVASFVGVDEGRDPDGGEGGEDSGDEGFVRLRES